MVCGDPIKMLSFSLFPVQLIHFRSSCSPCQTVEIHSNRIWKNRSFRKAFRALYSPSRFRLACARFTTI